MTKDRLESLIEASYDAARNADFELLVDLIPALEIALAQLAPNAEPGQLARLQRQTDRNALCFSAMGKGIRWAIRRQEEVGPTVSGLTGYDDRGQRLNLAVPEGRGRRF